MVFPAVAVISMWSTPRADVMRRSLECGPGALRLHSGVVAPIRR